MALGTAHMLGYKLAQNFDMPYSSANVSEVWRRWHISLSSWLRDYLFIPLGGSRGTKWQTSRNLLITMALGGLWHGANWTFVVWGVYHGLLLIGHRLFQQLCQGRDRLNGVLQSLPGTAGRVALTLLCVVLGWVLFRATTFSLAAQTFHRLLCPHGGARCPLPSRDMWLALVFVVLCHALARWGLWQRAVQRLPAPALGVAYGLALSLVCLLNLDTGTAFIYFQF
jgi:alginate O-acetyltransferase complex protein AlgI